MSNRLLTVARGDGAADLVVCGDLENFIAGRVFVGGPVVARREEVSAGLPLPHAGLISDRPVDKVRELLDGLTAAAHDCGCSHQDPLMALSLVALEVIPSLKLTDLGLVDVDRFDLVPLAVS